MLLPLSASTLGATLDTAVTTALVVLAGMGALMTALWLALRFLSTACRSRAARVARRSRAARMARVARTAVTPAVVIL